MSYLSFILSAVKNDDAFERMLDAAKQRLANRDICQIVSNGGLEADGNDSVLRFVSLGLEIEVRASDWSVAGSLGNWHALTILHYLDMADGFPLQNELITFGQQADGLARGGDFDRRCESLLGGELGRLTREQIRSRIQRLGGRLYQSNADLSAEFSFMPRYPLTLKLWMADEEFEGSARLFLDSSCGHYLSVEDAVTVGTILTEELRKT